MMHILPRSIFIFLLTLLLIPVAFAAESGVTVKAEELKSEPFRDAKTITTLALGDKVDILSKNGGWLKVKSAKGSGWVRMLSIRRGAARKNNSATDMKGLAGLASGRSSTGRIVATTGIRGLSEEELKAAKFDEAEIKLAESYLTSKTEAQKFATAGKLAKRKMDYLTDVNTSTHTGEEK